MIQNPMDELLFMVFPEQASRSFLLHKLEKAGYERDVLLKITNEEMVHKFFTFVAALPRRYPHQNRRGVVLQRQHMKEKKLSPKNNLLLAAKQEKSMKPQVLLRTDEVSSATPYLDRLAARSKAAKAQKCELPSTNTIAPSPPKQRIMKRKTSTKTTTQETLENGPGKDTKRLQGENKSPVQMTGVNSCEEKNKGQAATKKASGRIKIKRKSLQFDSLESCKVKKLS